MRFPVLVGNDVAAWSARVAVELERLLGELPVNGTVTLTASTTTTTVSNPAMTAARNVVLIPRTATAETATRYISTKSRGSFVITHDSTADTDRDFDFTII
jgi:hypothetical protein